MIEFRNVTKVCSTGITAVDNTSLEIEKVNLFLLLVVVDVENLH